MAGDEHRIAGIRAVPVEAQAIRGFGRLAVLVGAQDRHVQAPARELEVVRIAAELRDTALRREYQAHVFIALVLVEPVLTALIERHALAFECAAPGFGRGFLAGLLEFCQFPPPRLDDCVRSESRCRRGDLGRDVFRADQHGDRFFLAAQFFFTRARKVSIAHQIAVRGRILRNAFFAAVVIGQDQPVGGYEGAGAAALEAHGGQPDPVEPGGVERDAVFLADRGAWRIVESPHALVGRGRQGHHRGHHRNQDANHRELPCN